MRKKRTKQILHTILLFTIIFSVSCKTLLQKRMPNGIDFSSLKVQDTKVLKTFETAKANNKKVLLIFDAVWCGYCRKFNQQTMKDLEVRKTLADFETLNIDVDKYPKVVKAFESGSVYKKIKGVPTIMIFSSDGIQTDEITGYYKAKKFNKVLKRNL